MTIPEDLRYTSTHEWIRIEKNLACVGITDYAQDALGDIVFVELPEPGTIVGRGDETTNIESSKVAEALYSPVSGTLVSVNTELKDKPERIDSAPWSTHIFCLELSDPLELDDLMSPQEYRSLLEGRKAEEPEH